MTVDNIVSVLGGGAVVLAIVKGVFLPGKSIEKLTEDLGKVETDVEKLQGDAVQRKIDIAELKGSLNLLHEKMQPIPRISEKLDKLCTDLSILASKNAALRERKNE